MLKTKRSRSTKVVGKQKTSHPSKLDNLQIRLSKAGIKEIAPRARTYTSIAYFLKHRPVINRVYKAADILKGNESSLHFVGSTTRHNLLKFFKFKGIKAEGTKPGNKNLWTAFRFTK